MITGRGIARHGYPVLAGDRPTGVVTSGTQSPTLGRPIAMAYVAPGDAEPGTMLDVEIRDQRVPAEVVAAAVLQAGALSAEPAPGRAGQPPAAPRGARRAEEEAPTMVPADLRYTKDHEWVRVDGDEATVGITEYAANQLGDIVFVELPEAGRSARASSRPSASSSRSRP